MLIKKGLKYYGVVEKVTFPNKGKVRIYSLADENNEELNNDKNVEIKEENDEFATVKGVLSGQKIKFVISKKRNGKVEGRLLEVIEDSELENDEVICDAFGRCGGCTYQKISYENQLKIKENMVHELIGNVYKKDYEFEGIIKSPIDKEYRNKMEFSFGDETKGGELSLGMHKKNSFYDIVTTRNCKIVHNDYNVILGYVLDFFSERKIDFYHKMRKEGYLRSLIIRRGIKTGEILVGLVTTSKSISDEENVINELSEGLKKLDLEGNIVGFLHIYNDSVADVVKSDETKVIFGRDYIYEEILNLKFKISTFSFFQTNSLGAEKLYEKAREYVGDTKDKIVFDLYSGTGTIGQILSTVAKKVVGIEIVEEAVEAAEVNAKLNNINNCEFIAGDVLKKLDEVEEKPDIIVLDPPRDGVHPKALKKIVDYGVDTIVYISCKPTSLVRDLEYITENGYEIKKVACVDMYPYNYHVETVCLLSKNFSKPKDYV
ncbi:23S rRNA (uracil-5-)-methyltransferase RumA [Lachnospiraceae bacterium RM5]|nr:23S rRNA (uracil-5-)-methyltransferase RumA [Lachnospiraceae bacterium RM5]